MGKKSLTEVEKQDKDVYAQYQKNTTNAMNLQAEVLLGLKIGKPLGELLIYALEAIGQVTHSDEAVNQAKADLAENYGFVLNEHVDATAEIKKLEDRMNQMKNALSAEDIPDSDKRVIEASILAHQKAIRRLQNS